MTVETCLKSMQPLTWQNHATTEQHHTTSYSAQHHQVTASLSMSYNQALTEPLHATTYSATKSREVQVEKSPWAIHFLFMGVSSVTLSATSSSSINTIIITHQHHHGYSLSSITGVPSVTLSATSSSSTINIMAIACLLSQGCSMSLCHQSSSTTIIAMPKACLLSQGCPVSPCHHQYHLSSWST